MALAHHATLSHTHPTPGQGLLYGQELGWPTSKVRSAHMQRYNKAHSWRLQGSVCIFGLGASMTARGHMQVRNCMPLPVLNDMCGVGCERCLQAYRWWWWLGWWGVRCVRRHGLHSELQVSEAGCSQQQRQGAWPLTGAAAIATGLGSNSQCGWQRPRCNGIGWS